MISYSMSPLFYSFHKCVHVHTHTHIQNLNNVTTYLSRAGIARSVLCLTTDWMTGVQSLAGAKDFSSTLCVQTGSGATQPPTQWALGVPSPG
jgi:hypothetical protein